MQYIYIYIYKHFRNRMICTYHVCLFQDLILYTFMNLGIPLVSLLCTVIKQANKLPEGFYHCNLMRLIRGSQGLLLQTVSLCSDGSNCLILSHKPSQAHSKHVYQYPQNIPNLINIHKHLLSSQQMLPVLQMCAIFTEGKK